MPIGKRLCCTFFSRMNPCMYLMPARDIWINTLAGGCSLVLGDDPNHRKQLSVSERGMLLIRPSFLVAH